MNKIITFFIISSICFLNLTECSQRKEKRKEDNRHGSNYHGHVPLDYTWGRELYEEQQQEKNNRNRSNYHVHQPLHPSWGRKRYQEKKEKGIYYSKLDGQTFTNDKPLIINGLPVSQAIKNMSFRAKVTLKCETSTGKTLSAPTPHIERTGRYRDYFETYTYDFSRLKKPITCHLTVETEESDFARGHMVKEKDPKSKTGYRYEWKEDTKAAHANTTTYTFYVVPASTKASRK